MVAAPDLPVYTMPDGTETLCSCRVCGQPYVPDFRGVKAFTTCGKSECRASIRGSVTCETCGATVPRKAPGQRTCGQVQCRDALRYRTTDQRIRNRERCRLWDEAHGRSKQHNPWLAGPPIYHEHLPGGAMYFSLEPRPRWPIEHRNVRALHGMLTAISGDGHTEHDPTFAITPVKTRTGWAVYWWDDETSARLSDKTVDAVLFDQEVRAKFGPRLRMRAPKITGGQGHRRLLIDAITPVCSESEGHTGLRTQPTSERIAASLSNLPHRLKMLDWDSAKLRVELLDAKTQVGTVWLGDKYGVIRGWAGQVTVDTNAVGEWLLRCAAIVGLGARTAFGFGRINVECIDK